MRRSLSHFWPIQLSVALGAAVTAAVLTGALLVGDSVRGSLRDLTLDRLGEIDHALVSQRFFGEALAQDLSRSPGRAGSGNPVAPVISLTGSVIHTISQARASKVSIRGIDGRFLEAFGTSETLPAFTEDPHGRGALPVLINQALQRELFADIGDAILISLRKPPDVHPEFVLGSRDPFDLVESIRARIVQVLPDQGWGRFGLDPHQSLPLNVFLPLPALQTALEQKGRVNTLLVAAKGFGTESQGSALLEERLRHTLRLEDLNLTLREGEGFVALESSEMIIAPLLERAALSAASELGVTAQRVLTYLATSIAFGQGAIPYSTVTALDLSAAASLPVAVTSRGLAVPALESREILLNEWAGRDLGAGPGDSVELAYYVVGAREQLLTERARFEVKEIVALKGLGRDRTLTPEIPGVQDAENMAAWDPPVPIDLKRIRPQDEAYWDEFGATPKAFLSYQSGADLWSSRFGRLTSIRIPTTQQRFREALLGHIEPAALGLLFQPVKENGLRASAGATDFSVLFVSFSFFIIVSAGLLVGLLFRLGVEHRGREVGLLLSLGYSVRAVRRRFLAEGALVAGLGSMLGLAGAVVYAWLLIYALQTWWSPAVGSPFLSLHVRAASLAIGYLVSLLVVLASIWWAVRKLAEVPCPVLLAGGTARARGSRRGRWSRSVALASSGLAAILFLLAFLTGAMASVGLFFAMGASLLVAGLTFFSDWLKRTERVPIRPAALPARIAARNSARNPGRSLLSATLVASACFVIVSVEAFRHQPGAELLERDSGAGGFSLVAQSDVPLHQDLDAPDGRFELGFADSDSDGLRGVEILPFRVLPGEDVSCLNLYQPQQPRVLGVSSALVQRGGFRFQSLIEPAENPWTLLEQKLEPGVIPAFGDLNSVMWILHLGLGDDLSLRNERGEEVKLRLVGLLQSSIFQSELLISESDFLQHFPSRSGYSYFLIDAPLEAREAISTLLEGNLTLWGVDATPTSELLASYLAVENTYLSTFQTLGGLGLLLGTLGLGVVLVRNVLERKGELATLRAFGFRRSRLAWLVLAENAFLLLLGLLIGALSALLAVSPHLAGSGAPFPWQSLSLTLLAVFLVGLSAGAAALWVTLRIPLLPALKAEK